MAPEQASRGELDERSDVYAPRAILDECLSAARPYAPAAGRDMDEPPLNALEPRRPRDRSGAAAGARRARGRGRAERARERWPDHAAFLEHLGFADVLAGRVDEGVAHLVRSLELGQPSARGTLAHVRELLAVEPARAGIVAEIDAALGESR